MPVMLPYAFDTTRLGKIVMKSAVVLSGIFLLFAVKGIFIANKAYFLGGLIPAVAVYLFAAFIFRKMGGATGTIDPRDITIRPAEFWHIVSGVPAGTFPIQQFVGIRVEWQPRVGSPGEQLTPGNNEYIYLVSQPGAEDIEIARFTNGTGKTFAGELALLLGLKVEEKPAPGVYSLGRRRSS